MAKKASKKSAIDAGRDDQPDVDRFKFDVFLSHNSKDKPKVRKLAERLKAAGVRVWLDEWIVKAGDIITLKVDEGLEKSRVLLLCISPAAFAEVLATLLPKLLNGELTVNGPGTILGETS